MKTTNRLANFNHYSFEICFPKERLCGGRNRVLCDLFRNWHPLIMLPPWCKCHKNSMVPPAEVVLQC